MFNLWCPRHNTFVFKICHTDIRFVRRYRYNALEENTITFIIKLKSCRCSMNERLPGPCSYRKWCFREWAKIVNNYVVYIPEERKPPR